MKWIALKWVAGDAKGYTDWFPLNDFARATQDAQRIHLVLGPRGGRYHARCSIHVSGRSATLDYRRYRSFNNRHGMQLGVLEFHFANTSRAVVRDVLWNDVTILVGEAEVAVVHDPDLPGYTSSVGTRKYGFALRALRPEQLELYLELERTYGGCCVISGCPVPPALSAAHLVPVANGGNEQPTNAVLLRADLHALFDSNQLGINPRSRTVYLSTEAQAWPEYKKFHGRSTLAMPQPGFDSNKPKASAFAKRWSAFVSANPDLSLAAV